MFIQKACETMKNKTGMKSFSIVYVYYRDFYVGLNTSLLDIKNFIYV